MPTSETAIPAGHNGVVTTPGPIVILNGAPRSGKTSIARALQGRPGEVWVNTGVDASVRATPGRLQPGIGLRPGGERPDLEDAVTSLYARLFDAVAAESRLGTRVAVDIGLHESYSKPLPVRADCARRLRDLPVLLVGVHCPLDVIWRRRRDSWGQDPEAADPSLRAAVQRWNEAVHAGMPYDLEVDTSVTDPAGCADQISARLAQGSPGTALARLRAV
jgi:chloramphenicol 3-O phosphotransferase